MPLDGKPGPAVWVATSDPLSRYWKVAVCVSFTPTSEYDIVDEITPVTGSTAIAAKVTSGLTLLTVTRVVSSVKPPSLSMIRARTVSVEGPSGYEHVVEALVLLVAYVADARLALLHE